MAKEATAPVESATKSRKGQAAPSTTVLLYVNEAGKPAVYAHSRNGRSLLDSYAKARDAGIDVTPVDLAPLPRTKSEAA